MYRNLLVRRYAPSFQKRTIRRPHIPEVHLPSPEIKFTVHTADAFCSCRINQLVFRSISAKAETPSGFHCKSLSRKYTCHSLQSVATVFQWFWHRRGLRLRRRRSPLFLKNNHQRSDNNNTCRNDKPSVNACASCFLVLSLQFIIDSQLIMSKILIVEDEVAIADLERDYLELSGFDVEVANDGEAGLAEALRGDYNLVILDLMLPGVDGFEICRKVREEKNTPIIMVSAKKDDIDKIRGLGLGADDYMTKPFSPSELVARVKAHLARYERLIGSAAEVNKVINWH